jgi:release factor glutamine methyltransferase
VTEAGVLLGDLVADAGHMLAAARIPEPRREALRLWADLAGASPADGILARRASVSATQLCAFRSAVERRAGGEPLAYVSGWAGFRRLTLQVDRRVLIPRPETEGLVELVLARSQRGIVADVCTGSGCIALSLADEGRYDRVLGLDLSGDALAVAAGNVRSTGLPLTLVRADLTAPLPAASIDVLVANPPYIAAAEYAVLDRSVRDWEPRIALEGGSDGQDAIRRLLDDGRRVLTPGGWIALEIDSSRAAGSAAVATAYGWEHVMIHHDLFGRERYLLAQRSEIS